MCKDFQMRFGQTQVEYLGHTITINGVDTGPSKLQVIAKWPAPTNVTQHRSFLGLTRYYKRFIRDYGVICKCIYQALKKGDFVWTNEQHQAFKLLKIKMTHAPILAMLDFSKPIILETDASGYGPRVVLMQQRQPVAFMSKTIGPKATTWSTYDKEALAILEA